MIVVSFKYCIFHPKKKKKKKNCISHHILIARETHRALIKSFSQSRTKERYVSTASSRLVKYDRVHWNTSFLHFLLKLSYIYVYVIFGVGFPGLCPDILQRSDVVIYRGFSDRSQSRIYFKFFFFIFSLNFPPVLRRVAVPPCLPLATPRDIPFLNLLNLQVQRKQLLPKYVGFFFFFFFATSSF